ncbi:hypothetical protein H310_01962 [Aphanomyces invadans]|uniref:Uncharacterized protein n=1 Tax=Aphanomyces invadans TaxID=157072 RepID=A0A024UPC2_9STRA|nr:hypothetical protein H310_01962 [Aphanomyces invadans]ETW07448.1 hypothetical protein H310_01962 [Aphanomyces invadans]|eukprot:XP_008863541.1 hypothetical protein H310_01962 [Aphanomyces invadans]
MSLAAQSKRHPTVQATAATQTDRPTPRAEITPFQGTADPAVALTFNEQYIQFIQHLSQKGRDVNNPLPPTADAAAHRKHRVENALHVTVCQVFSNPKMIATIRDIVFAKLQAESSSARKKP